MAIFHHKSSHKGLNLGNKSNSEYKGSKWAASLCWILKGRELGTNFSSLDIEGLEVVNGNIPPQILTQRPKFGKEEQLRVQGTKVSGLIMLDAKGTGIGRKYLCYSNFIPAMSGFTNNWSNNKY